MGLDMYLNKRTYIGAEYEHRKVKGKIEITEGEEDKPINIQFNRVSEIIERVAYWRKANQIHKWFVDHVQEGKDDCGEYYVSTEKLKELIQECKSVLEKPETGVEKLPTKSGFFFGGTEYDEYYYNDLRDTVDQIEPLLSEKDGSFYYKSSW